MQRVMKVLEAVGTLAGSKAPGTGRQVSKPKKENTFCISLLLSVKDNNGPGGTSAGLRRKLPKKWCNR